jgi:hypothetical protein
MLRIKLSPQSQNGFSQIILVLFKVRFLFNSQRKMSGNLVCLPGNLIRCSKNVLSLITVNKLKKMHLKYSFYTFVDLYCFSSDHFKCLTALELRQAMEQSFKF